MKFSLIAVGFAALAAAAPLSGRQNNVFSTQTFNDLSISGGTAGTAEQEALDKLSGLPTDLTQVSKADLDFLNSVNQIANDAEKEAFNPAIEAATGEEADALQRGKIKNKVLKLTATVMKLQAQQAQGQDVTAKMAEEQKKLDNNIAQDVAEAGNESTALDFEASTA
ncbi:small secreted protein [Colletotrichum tofieldiae]|uniref:Small secreted protein n=1 Tax=Colletotrichum tofieldiae TaxID=708197 RepID=A0A161WR31_9PEZI|nr:small secreted protein [Colletotrichum tofieldiae]GKT58399.1 small secreted protein [Colletotrichum tofieldiae]GKT79907.1 small secreted protein [Colletotrichum tofieldiae]GKT84484.1 small secreted protein [Colletotrichum tofieldiae]